MNSLAKDPYFEQYAKDLCKRERLRNDAYKDLLQYTWLCLAEKSTEEIVKLESQNIKGFVCRILWINAMSETAPFRRGEMNYSQLNDDIIQEECDGEKEIIIKIAEDFLKKETEYWEKKEKLPAWNVKVLELYAELGSYRKVEEVLHINYQTVRHIVLDLINRINEHFINNRP